VSIAVPPKMVAIPAKGKPLVSVAINGVIIVGSFSLSVNCKVQCCNLKDPVNILYMKKKERKMTDRYYDTGTPDPSDPMTDGRTNDNPPMKRWHLIGENYSAARRALYAARAQLG